MESNAVLETQSPESSSESGNDATLTGADPTREAAEDRLLLELLAGRPVGEAAAAAGISRSQGLRIRRSSEFQRRFSEARQELLTAAVDRLRSHAADFVSTLHGIALDKAARGSDRVLASRHGLDLLFRGVEAADLSERVGKLEAIADGEKAESSAPRAELNQEGEN